jgi:glyoxylase-like metal-dependent hydrolase (beta-lactamase superfamily II)
VRPEEVTDVFITHSHFDHVGGLAGPGGLRFPNAVIHMSAREWTFLKSQPQNAKLVLAISPKVRPFEPGETLAPGVRAIPLYGHTPGHVAYEIMSGDQRLLDIGDLAHSSIVSLARPDWAMAYDQDQVAGAATRVRTLDRLASNKTLIFAPHFPFPGIGTIERDGAGYVFTPKAP